MPVTTNRFSGHAIQDDGTGQNQLEPRKNELTLPVFSPPNDSEPVSTSVLPPQANSLQFKAGGLAVALAGSRNPPPLQDFVARPGVLIAAHRVGYTGTGILSNGTRAIAGIGQLLDPYSQRDKLSTELQISKAIGNATGYAIDFSRVDDKQSAARNYLCAPRRQGAYTLGSGHEPLDGVELRSMRKKPKLRHTQTDAPQRVNAETQTAPSVTRDMHTQAAVPTVSSSVQTVSPQQVSSGNQAGLTLRNSATQAGVDSRSVSMQTDAAANADLNGNAGHGAKSNRMPVESGTTDRSIQSVSIETTDAGTQITRQQAGRGTQVTSGSRVGATQTDAKAKADASSDATIKHADAASQAQTSARDHSAQTDPGQRGEKHLHETRKQVDSETQAEVRTLSASMQTDAKGTADAANQSVVKQANREVQIAVDSRVASTQTGPSTTKNSGSQASSKLVSSETQVERPTGGSGSSGPSGIVASTSHNAKNRVSSGTQTEVASRHGVVQTDTKRIADAGSQVTRNPIDRELQTESGTRDKSVQAHSGRRTDIGCQTVRKRANVQTQVAPNGLTDAIRGKPATNDSVLGAGVHKLNERVPPSVKGNVHWLPIDMLGLASSGSNVRKNRSFGNVSAVCSDSIGAAGDSIAVANLRGSKTLAIASKTLSLLSTAVGLAPSISQLSSDVIDLIRNPDSTQAKWNTANSSIQLGAGLVAAAASVVFPPAALAPLLFPSFSEIGHAIELQSDEHVLRSNGLSKEADAVHAEYVAAGLDATPVVNWFSSFYTSSIRPDIERFELSQGNKPGAAPKGELPFGTRGDPRVFDYYGEALRERVQSLESAARDYLKNIANASQLDSVTLISRSPQMFGWPSSGQPMRVFDRAVALTYSRKTGTVSGTFFGKEADGAFRLALLNEGISMKAGEKNVVVLTNMLDNEKQSVRFDLAAYKADTTGSIYVIDPDKYAC